MPGEENTAALINIAQDVGSLEAQTENLETTLEETTAQVDTLETMQQYTREEIDRLFERCWAMDDRISDLEAKFKAMEIAAAESLVEDLEEEEALSEDPGEPTIIEGAEPPAEEKPAPKAKKNWGLF